MSACIHVVDEPAVVAWFAFPPRYDEFSFGAARFRARLILKVFCGHSSVVR